MFRKLLDKLTQKQLVVFILVTNIISIASFIVSISIIVDAALSTAQNMLLAHFFFVGVGGLLYYLLVRLFDMLKITNKMWKDEGGWKGLWR